MGTAVCMLIHLSRLGGTGACITVYCNKIGMLCQLHAGTHPHDDYGNPVSIVNSPRMGMCGYDGPAEPPY